MRKADRILFAAGALFIGGYFWLLAGGAVHGYFSSDDLMNLHRAWTPPLGKLISGNLLFFLHSEFYRPLAEAWYRSIYYFAGFNPAPFKVINLAIVFLNIALTYNLVRRLSHSGSAAALAALLFSYHARFVMIYTDTGFIYDVLCYFFYFSTVTWYVRIRQEGRLPKLFEVIGCALLYICAVDSKEIAVSLPVTLLAYELTLGGKAEGWLAIRRWWTVLLTGAMTALFIGGRILSPDSLLQNEAYRPVLTWSRFMETSVSFTNELFYSGQWFTPGKLLVLWAAMLAYALATRSRILQFAWMFLMIAPLPVAFLLPRDAPQYYVPFFGWVLYAAAMIVDGIELAVAKLPAAVRPWTRRAAGALAVAGIAGALYPYEKQTGAYAPSVTIEGEEMRCATAQLRALYARLPARARLYFLDDPTPSDWNLLFLVQLAYRDATLVVEPVHRKQPRPADEQLASYDHVFDYRGGHLTELKRPWQFTPTPAIAIHEGRPQFFHEGFHPVTQEKPAMPNEYVISKAFDLGQTVPAMAPGEGFPNDPLASVTATVAVRVNGREAEPGAKVGWPGEINRYRVDFRLPPQTQPGVAKVTLTVNGVAGPPTEIYVGEPRQARRYVPAPRIAVEAGRPQVFHRDWTPVTREQPVKPGEDIITKALDLGETRPAAPAGRPFPIDPLAEIVSKIEVRVNGQTADTSVKVGWPNEVNRYRVDIHIPETTRSGMAKLTLRVNGASGKAVEVPVR